MKKTYKYVRVTSSHVEEANGNSGFLIKEVDRGDSKLAKVMWFEPRSRTYSSNWFARHCVRDK